MPKRMDLTSKLRQHFVLDKIKRTDWCLGTSAPLVVELDTTEACDLACPGCISEEIMKTQNRFSNERLLELGRELVDAGVKAVVLIGGGEPLAHPKAGELIEYFGENDVHVGITTNGTFIRRYLDPIADYASWTRVSMDASTAGTFDQLRPAKNGNSKFEYIVENMRMLAKRKTGKLGFSFLIRTEADGPGVVSNIHEIYDAAALARDIGCDYFEVKPSYQYRDNIEHALMKHEQRTMDEARCQVERLDELAAPGFSIMKAINLDYSLSGVQELQLKNYHTCPAAQLRTMICPSGVFVCPYWRGKERMRVGELHETSFADLWLGDRRRQVMQYLDPGEHCNFHCLRHESNVETLRLVRRTAQGCGIDPIDEFDRFI